MALKGRECLHAMGRLPAEISALHPVYGICRINYHVLAISLSYILHWIPVCFKAQGKILTATLKTLNRFGPGTDTFQKYLPIP